METTADLIVYWAGACVFLACLTAVSVALAIALSYTYKQAFRSVLKIINITTARYWVQRMESEGLTICHKEYRRMVAEHKPNKWRDFVDVERQWNAASDEQPTSEKPMQVKQRTTREALLVYCERLGQVHALSAQGEPSTVGAASRMAMGSAYLHCAAMLKDGLTPQQLLQLQDLLKAQTKPPQTLAMPFGVRLRLLFAIAFGLLLPLQSRGRTK